jgi:acyl carrier protein
MNHEEIVQKILEYIYESNPVAAESKPLPLDESLFELGILDSFGVVELVCFIEEKFEISVLDSELTAEKFGGVNKMAALVTEKLDNGKKLHA